MLDGFAESEMCDGGRGQQLIPWPNRIKDGTYRFGSAKHQLPLTEPERANAIHGLVRWAPWAPKEHSTSRLVMNQTLYPQPGYPFSLELEIDFGLSKAGLEVSISALNAGVAACPFGAGAHPYFAGGDDRIDTARLRCPGRTRLVSDDRGIPTGREAVSGTEFDFLELRQLGGLRLDHAYADLVRDADGRARAVVSRADGGSATIWLDEAYPYLMVFSGDTLSSPRRRRGLALEPMSCPANAFQTGEGLRVLQPGEEFHGSWGIEPAL